MSIITATQGYVYLIIFGIVMWIITKYYSRGAMSNSETFLVANRNVGLLKGSLSIAVSWIWAPAIFLSIQKAYEQGLPGIFWFTYPNIVSLLLFAFLAVKIKKLVPNGYTFPEYIKSRFDKKVHIIYSVVFFSWQITAIAINCLAGGALINLLTGIPYHIAVIIIASIALSYTLFSGLKASIVTDAIQMLSILVIIGFLVPWLVKAGGGLSAISLGLGGVSGEFTNMFDPLIAYSFGISASIGLIAGTMGDQMFWQRAHSVKRKHVRKSFIYGAFIFGIVPIALSLVGFLAANPAINQTLTDPLNGQMIGVQVVESLLPSWAGILFVIMLLSGLCSTLDSALCAGSSMGAIDIYQTYINPKAKHFQILTASRMAMLLMTIVGVGIALIPGMKILYIFLIYGAMMASTLVPTVLSLWWTKAESSGIFFGVLVGFLVGVPLSVYGNFLGNTHWVVLSSVLPVIISTVFSGIGGIMTNKKFNYKVFAEGVKIVEP